MADINEISERDLEKFADVLDDIVNADGIWQDKKDSLMNRLPIEAQNNIEEFIGWFDE